MPGRFGKKTIDDLKGGKDSPIEFSQHIKVEHKPTTKQPFLDEANRQVHPPLTPLKKSTSKNGSNFVGSYLKNLSDSGQLYVKFKFISTISVLLLMSIDVRN